MLYAIRNEEGRIISLSETFQTGAEAVDIKNKEVLAFLSINDNEFSAEEFLEQSDAAVSRIFEDLIDVLVGKNIIMFTDLPPMAQKKLLSRKLARNLNRQEGDSDTQTSTSFLIVDDDETI
ncbi:MULTISPECIES: hypothetical protein [unclassified Neptuniibacter]|jgi:hypothetical protein|uniref:hypothetical protein n=1 Tax=unclassified Neptuniibacter TaxID=2630693 RepID=UPI0026E1E038|nr:MULTISPECIES: hypothetical protein [unclassified Neptuniibacter]MDO6514259.1 hypothetical protein [Neptuniibacter sp. 2_MG-2023]MDO6592612.1 hypothetical protein [Neptuniibacter sp. 1_MG-2023]